jgi:FkbM family methyltransferase
MSAAEPDTGLTHRQTRASGILVDVIANLDDLYYQSRLAAPDNFEPAVSVAGVILPADGVALDLGACLGIVSAAVSQFVPDGRVIALEPSGGLQAGLERTCSSVTNSNITVVHSAVGAEEGSVSFHAQATGAAWGYVGAGGNYSVKQTTVDLLVRELGLERLDFVKIDTEGSELAVLEGAIESIRRFAPVLAVELNPFCLWKQGRTLPQDLVTWIRERYEYVWSIDPEAVVTRLDTDAAIDQMFWQLGSFGGLVDLIASPRPIDFPVPLWAPPVVATASPVATSSEPQQPGAQGAIGRLLGRRSRP